MMKKFRYLFLFLSLSTLFCVNLFSQEATIISPNIQMQYFKNTDNMRILKTTLTCSSNSMELPLPGMEVSFFSGRDEKVLIAKILTDNQGVATLELNEDFSIKEGKDGLLNFSTEIKGNDTIEAATSELTVKDLTLEMALTLEDTIRTVTVKAFTSDNGVDTPLSGETVNVYVPRMFSLLKIGELSLDDSGTASVEFPPGLPGDKEGNLTLIAKLADNTTYGNVEKQETLKWGLPTNYSVPITYRALWTKTAPIWMIYTLSVLLIGVRGHYLFAFISLIRIKRDAVKQAKTGHKI